VKRRLGPSGDGHGGHVLRPINLESDHAHGYLRWDGSYTQARACLGDRKVIRKVSAAYGMSDPSRAPGTLPRRTGLRRPPARHRSAAAGR
jgi:hypothetical protein